MAVCQGLEAETPGHGTQRKFRHGRKANRARLQWRDCRRREGGKKEGRAGGVSLRVEGGKGEPEASASPPLH